MFSKLLGFFGISSWGAYAIAGIFIVVSGLGISLYVQSLRLDEAKSRVEQVEAEKSQLSEALQESQDNLSRLRERERLTDALVKQLGEAKVKAEKARKEADAAYAKLKSELDAQDQACLDRPIPEPLASRLRD